MIDKSNFIEKLIETNADINPIIALLLARGFLLEIEDGKWVLSDNSDDDDICFLNEILIKHDVGYMDRNVMNLSANSSCQWMEEYFAEKTHISYPVVYKY